jgi:ankyrin repeat protein
LGIHKVFLWGRRVASLSAEGIVMAKRGGRIAGVVAIVLAAAVGVARAESRLIGAVKSGDRVGVRALIDQHVDVNGAEVDGTTALHWAVRAEDLDTVELLLQAGADEKAANRYGVTPLSLAAENGNAAVLQALLEAGADPHTVSPGGDTVVMTAARSGNANALKVLLAHGATNVDAKEGWLGESALMWAAAENHALVVQMLIEAGADVDARSNPTPFPRVSPPVENLITMTFARGGWTPIMYAARQGALAAARALADGGADLNAASPDGLTAVTIAIINAHYDTAALLLEKGADPDIADASGMTALYAAVDMRTLPWMQGRPAPRTQGRLEALDVVKLALARGANPNAPLKTPLLQRQHTAGDRMLGEGTTPFMRAARFGDVAVMRLLLDHGADPHLLQKDHTNALMLAAAVGSDRVQDEAQYFQSRGTEANAVEAIKLCLEAGVDILAFNDNGETALHQAIGGDIMRFLVDQGADLQARNKRGKRPLEVALERRTRDGDPFRPENVALLRRLMGEPETGTSAPGRPPSISNSQLPTPK